MGYLCTYHKCIIEFCNSEALTSLAIYVPLQYQMQLSAAKLSSNESLALNILMDTLLCGTKEEIAVCLRTKSTKDSRIISLQGAAGTGKSLFGWRCMQAYSEHLNSGKFKPRIPVFIALGSAKCDFKNTESCQMFLFDQLKKSYPSDKRDAIEDFWKNKLDPLDRSAFKHISFIFILDGVDELKDKCEIHRLYDLEMWPESYFIISTRTGFFYDLKQLHHYLAPSVIQNDLKLPHSVVDIVLLSFNEEQQGKYIELFAGKHQDVEKNPLWYRDQLNRHPEFNIFLTEPLSLFMVLCNLSSTSTEKLRLDSKFLYVKKNVDQYYTYPTFSRTELYCIFAYNWVDREIRKRKLPEKIADEIDKHEIEIRNVINFCGDLAFQMFTEGTVEVDMPPDPPDPPVVSMPDGTHPAYVRINCSTGLDDDDCSLEACIAKEAVKGERKNVGSSAEEVVNDGHDSIRKFIRSNGTQFERSPIRRRGSYCSFLHKTVLECFVAYHVCSQLFRLQCGSKLKDIVVSCEYVHTTKKCVTPVYISQQLLHSGDVLNTVRFCADFVDPRSQEYITFGPIIDRVTKTFSEESPVCKDAQYLAKALWTIVQGSRLPDMRNKTAEDLSAVTATANAITILNAANMIFDHSQLSYATLGPTSIQLALLHKPENRSKGTSVLTNIHSGSSVNSTTTAPSNVATSEKTPNVRFFSELSGAVFSNANLENACLNLANLTACNLISANLKNAQLDRIMFGQLPAIQDTFCSNDLPILVTPDGQTIIAIREGAIYCWPFDDITKKRALFSADLKETTVSAVCCISLSRNGKQLASGDEHGKIRIWSLDLDERERKTELFSPEEAGRISCPSRLLGNDPSINPSAPVDKLSIIHLVFLPGWSQKQGAVLHNELEALEANLKIIEAPHAQADQKKNTEPTDAPLYAPTTEAMKESIRELKLILSEDKFLLSTTNEGNLSIWSLESGERCWEEVMHQSDNGQLRARAYCSLAQDSSSLFFKYILIYSTRSTVIEIREFQPPDTELDAAKFDIVYTQEGPLGCLGINQATLCLDARHIIATIWGEAPGHMNHLIYIWPIVTKRKIAPTIISMEPTTIATTITPTPEPIATELTTPFTTLTGHTDYVKGVEIIPEGKYKGRIVSYSADRSIRIWSLESKAEVVPSVMGHKHGVASLTVTCDGEYLTSFDNVCIKFWQCLAFDNRCRMHPKVPFSYIEYLASDDEYVVTLSRLTINVWRIQTGLPLYAIENPMCNESSNYKDYANGVAIANMCVNDKNYKILCASSSFMICFWQLDMGGKFDYKIELKRESILWIQYCEKENSIYIVVGCTDLTVRLWQIELVQFINEALPTIILKVKTEKTVNVLSSVLLMTARLTTDLKRIFYVKKDELNIVYSQSFDEENKQSTCITSKGGDEKIIGYFCGMGVKIDVIRISNGGQLVAFSASAQVQKAKTRAKKDFAFNLYFDAVAGEGAKFIGRGYHSLKIKDMNFTADDKILITCSEDWTVRLWNVNTFHFVQLDSHSSWVNCLTLTKKYLVTGSGDKSVHLWTLPSNIEVDPPCQIIRVLGNVDQTEARGCKYENIVSCDQNKNLLEQFGGSLFDDESSIDCTFSSACKHKHTDGKEDPMNLRCYKRHNVAPVSLPPSPEISVPDDSKKETLRACYFCKSIEHESRSHPHLPPA